MYKQVDLEEVEVELEGFSYLNKHGTEEYVKFYPNSQFGMIQILYNVGIFIEDIPKLQKALEAAYNHWKQK